MAYNIMRDALAHTVARRRKDKWTKVISGMAAVVVFCTTYALILPAITMENEEQQPVCGIEAHAHAPETCYELPKKLTCEYMASDCVVIHKHNEFCYDHEGKLICTLPEIEAHTHTDACYETVTPAEPHVHSGDCWEVTQVCELEEYTHDPETCYDEDGSLICEKEEHTHGDACVEKKNLCGLNEATAEELAAYAEGPVTKQICGKEEYIAHTHTDTCYDGEGHLICGRKEVLVHEHTAECLTEIADAEPVLVCKLPVHEHTDECFNTADLESPIDWEITLPELADKKAWAENLVAVAESQLGYHESIENIRTGADGTIYGYTRYGQWADKPYGDWSLTFLDFCLHYAGIPADAFPVHEGQPRWCNQLQEENWNIYWTPAQYTPVPGDTVYLDLNLDGNLDAAAIVKELSVPGAAQSEETLAEGEEAETQAAPAEGKAVLTVIQGAIPGETSKEVAIMKYDASDAVILGYACLDTAMTRWEFLNPEAELPEIETDPEQTTKYYCGQEEHAHDPETCYDAEGVLTCEIPEHTHTDECTVVPPSYRCGLVEHEHDEYCRDNEGNMTCQLEQHKHTDECIVYYICGQEEHTHDLETCYDENGELICELEEHTHEDVCMLTSKSVEAEIDSPFDLLDALTGNKPSVTVSGYLPEGVKVTAIPLDVVDVEDALFAYDITIYDAEGNEFQPLIPVQVSFYVPGITDDPEQEVEIYHGESVESEETSETTELTEATEATEAAALNTDNMILMDSRPDGNGGIVVDAPHFSPFYGFSAKARVAGNDSLCTEDECDKDNYMKNWIPTSNDYPFGGAQNFNLFVLGDLKGWNAIHGNSAVGGNVLGNKNTTPGYDEHSNFDYEANITPENDVCFLLRGNIQMEGVKLVVSNGNAIVKENIVTDKEVNDGSHVIELHNAIRPTTHIHKIKIDGEFDLFDEYFAAAGMPEAAAAVTGGTDMDLATFRKSEYYEGSLIQHNDHIDEYAKRLVNKNDGHLGSGSLASAIRVNSPGSLEASGLGGIQDNAYVLHGENPFYNVFNVESWEIAPPTVDGERMVYLDIPYGSYVMVNFLGRDEAGNVINKIPDVGIQFWYKDSAGEWSKQPAKIKSTQAADYDQSQMVLFNFEPQIEEVNFMSANGYFYASVLAPNVDLYAHGLNLQGTIVFENMYGEGNNNIVYSPFYTGASMQLQKRTVCDNPGDTGHATLSKESNKTECQIHSHGENGPAWDDYFADLKFSISSSAGEISEPAIKRGLPMNGKGVPDKDGNPQDWFTISGLSPGYYSVIDELVWRKAVNGDDPNDPDFKERRLTVDKDGYYAVAMYIKPDYRPGHEGQWLDDDSANKWKLVYCNEKPTLITVNGKQVMKCSIPPTYAQWVTDEDTPEMVARRQALIDGTYNDAYKTGLHQANQEEFYIYKHHWNYAGFIENKNGQDVGDEQLTIIVQSDPEGNVEDHRYTLVNHYSLKPAKNIIIRKAWGEYIDVPDSDEDKWVDVEAPEGAFIEVTLYQSTDGVKWTKVKLEDEKFKNPVRLDREGAWDYMWTNLPETDSENKPLQYKVKETRPWPGFTSEEPFEDPDGSGKFVLRNVRRNNQSIGVEKIWLNEDGTLMEDISKCPNVDVTLYRITGDVREPYNPKSADPENLENKQYTKYLRVYNGMAGVQENTLAELPFIAGDVGSDLTLEFTVWMDAYDYTSTNLGGIDELKLSCLFSGAQITKRMPVSGQGGDGISHPQFGNRYPVRFAVQISNANKDVDLVLSGPATLPLDQQPDPAVKKTFQIIWDATGEPDGVTVPKITAMEITRFDPTSIKWRTDPMEKYNGMDGTGRADTTLTQGHWTHEWPVPLYQGEDTPNDPTDDDKMIRYGYYVVETPIKDYDTKYFYTASGLEHDDSWLGAWDGLGIPNQPPVGGVGSGYVEIYNSPRKITTGPVLPMTGGIGTLPYTFGGLLAASAAFFLLQYKSKKRRKEDGSL